MIMLRNEGWSTGRGGGFLFGRNGSGCRDEFRSLLLEVGGFGRGASKVCLSEVGGTCGWGGVDIGDPGGAANRIGFDRSISVELELHDGVLGDSRRLASIEAIDFPGSLGEWVGPGLFFPDRSVGVFAPLVTVTVTFPERGLLGGGVEVEVATDLSRDGGSAGIVFTQELPSAKERGHQ